MVCHNYNQLQHKINCNFKLKMHICIFCTKCERHQFFPKRVINEKCTGRHCTNPNSYFAPPPVFWEFSKWSFDVKWTVRPIGGAYLSWRQIDSEWAYLGAPYYYKRGCSSACAIASRFWEKANADARCGWVRCVTHSHCSPQDMQVSSKGGTTSAIGTVQSPNRLITVYRAAMVPIQYECSLHLWWWCTY